MGPQLITGVIEGFYGPPWTDAERLGAFETLSGLGLDTYVYAPKDDLSLRTLWREPYDATRAEALRRLIDASLRQDVQFVWGVSPGLDIRYADDGDLARLHARLEQLLALGCRRFALLFDDVPDRLDARDLARWGSLAAAQAHAVNACHSWLRRRDSAARLAMCPTAYCERMSRAGLGGPGYLEALGRLLDPAIDVFWTGPDIISREISPAHAREVRALLRRKPLIWDNLHANDYDGRRMFCGPYAGRDTALLDDVAGILSNPNCEWPLNAIPLRTLAGFVRAGGTWDARRAYLDGVRAWSHAFETVHGPGAFDDLVLFLDCYYLPHEEGDEARALYDRIKAVMRAAGSIARHDVVECLATIARLRDFCARLSDLCDRPLFHALWRRSWELREELDLLARYVQEASSRSTPAVRSDVHLPSTYRGGMVPRLQRLLTQRPDGAFVPASTAADGAADHDADHAT
jgi:protein O-GlcNAcase/histone acetyltransferase